MGWTELSGSRLGDYEIVDEIARGGMSRVFKAHDLPNGRDVAIKIMAVGSDSGDPRGFTRRFEHEARAVERLDHPNIVKVFMTGETDEFVYIVMQLVLGGTFRSRLGKPLPVPDACSMAIQMAQALHHAHMHHVIHRDVKPANMLIDADDPGHLLLADFGIAKIMGQKGVTKTGTAVGTPEYMAPEQAKGEEIDQRADIYGLACVLYEALAGRPPFVGPTALSICYQHVHTRPAYIRGFNPDVPRALALVIEQALAKNPGDRFPDAEAFAVALHPFTEPTGVVLRRSRPLTSPLREIEMRGTPDGNGLIGGGERLSPAMLPPSMQPSSLPSEPIAPLNMATDSPKPVLDLTQLPAEPAMLPTIDDPTTRQTQEMTPMATPARPRHTRPTTQPGPKLKSRPGNNGTTVAVAESDRSPIDGAASPLGGDDIAGRSTVQTPVPPKDPRASYDQQQPQRRRIVILIAVAIVASLIALLVIHAGAQNSPKTVIAPTAIPTLVPTATTAPTVTATGAATLTPIVTTTPITTSPYITRFTVTTTQADSTCDDTKSVSSVKVGTTLYFNVCYAPGNGNNYFVIDLHNSTNDTTTKSNSILTDNSEGYRSWFYQGIGPGTYTAQILWYGGTVASTLTFTAS